MRPKVNIRELHAIQDQAREDRRLPKKAPIGGLLAGAYICMALSWVAFAIPFGIAAAACGVAMIIKGRVGSGIGIIVGALIMASLSYQIGLQLMMR